MNPINASPTIIIIFGATGDLTHRKLLPALYTLYREKFIRSSFEIIGFARRPYTDREFQEELRNKLLFHTHGKNFTQAIWKEFSSFIHYQQGTFQDKQAYRALNKRLHDFDVRIKVPYNKILYLATPPKYYDEILANLKHSGMAKDSGIDKGWTRIVIEKPFGKNLQTAKALDMKLSEQFKERQIYRIDHYLGKETVQNILAFRFANNIFEPIWNKDHIDHIQITMAETAGLDGRGAFYEGVGALRDVAQNHLLMLMALFGMEQPGRFDQESVRNARAAFMGQIACIPEKEVAISTVRGQYGLGIIRGKAVPAYRDEEEVAKNSITDTYVALKLFVDNNRWRGVPFYLRTGKRLKKNVVEISVVFRQTCQLLFAQVGCPEESNVLTLRISPEEGFSMRLIVKKPGHEFKLKSVDMDLRYHDLADSIEDVDAYERLLQDIFRGDQMLFNRSDELEASWELVTNILYGWTTLPQPKRPNYAPGTWGPKDADELMRRDGREWILD